MTDKSFQHTLKQIHKAQDKIAPLIEGLEDDIPQQSMKDYFVKLQILLKEDEDQKNGNYESISGEKKEVELASIFDKLTKDGTAPTKLLILGGAGVGKTTLMQYIAYKWGAGELWQDKFDHVYRVSLKTLLNDHWKDDYNKEEIREDILKCLVHYNLVMRMNDEMDEPTLKGMHWSAETEKTLLLLDGYDEIAHLKNSNTPNKDYQRLEKKIFEHKNLIFTSRPNAVSKTMKTQFDKVLENTGLTKSGIDHYFNLYFRDDKKGKEAELRKFLAGNQVIWQICTVPVNIAMLCYIWSTSKSTDGLQNISTASSLYKNVIDRLGQRYFAKEWNADDKTDKVTLEEALMNGEFTLDEFGVLAHVAYKALTGGGINVAEEDRVETLIIRGAQDKDGEIDLTDQDGISVLSSINYLAKHKMIQDDQKKKVTVGKVCRYGLLKVEGTVSSLNNKKSDINSQRLSYSFLHLTFQEYLAAYYLKEQLTSEQVSEKEKREICQYIAEHRNEPRYLMMLKFMAGIVAADQSAKAGEYAVKVFWDAIVCNVDGVIELGIETKISLMIHLLGQAKVNGKMDPRIPHKDEACLLIEAVVLSDLFGWTARLKESDFITDTLKEAVMHAFMDDNLTWSNKKLAEIEAKSSSSLQAAIHKIIKNKPGKDLTESGQSSGVVTGLAIGMINEVNLKLTPDENLTIMRKLKDMIITYEKQSVPLLKQVMEEWKRRILGSPLSDKESVEMIDFLVPMLRNDSLRYTSLDLIIQIVKISGKKDMALRAMGELDNLFTDKKLLETDLATDTAFWICSRTAEIARAVNDSSLIPIGLEKMLDCLNKSQDAVDALGAGLRMPESFLVETFSGLLLSTNDKDVIAKALDVIFRRAKQRNYQGLMATKYSISYLISQLKDKEVIAICMAQISHLLLSEASQTTQELGLKCLSELIQVAKDKVTALKIFEILYHLIHDNKLVDEGLKAFGIKVLGEALAMIEDPVFAQKEMEKVFKLFESIQGSSKSMAIEGLFRVVKMYKDKQLATKLIEYIITNDCSGSVEAVIQLVSTVEKEKEVMSKFIEYMSRLLSPNSKDIKPHAIELVFKFFEVFEDKYETSKVIESLVSMHNDGIKQNIKMSPYRLNKTIRMKIIEHAMRLLDNDNTQIRCANIELLCLLMRLRKDTERASDILGKLTKILTDQDLAVKKCAIGGIDDMLGLIENDELAAQVIQQHEVSSLVETINYPTPNLIQATVRMFVKRNERESIIQMVDRMIKMLSSQESDDHKISTLLSNINAVFLVAKDKELAEKTIDELLKIIPSHLTREQMRKMQSSLVSIEWKAVALVNNIIKISEDQKLALKLIDHIILSDDPQEEENCALLYITLDTIKIANNNQLTAKLLKEFIRWRTSPLVGINLKHIAMDIIVNFWVNLEQLLQYLEGEDFYLRADLIWCFSNNAKVFMERFTTMEKLLKSPQSLTIEVVNEKLFDKQLKEPTQTEIKALISTLKDDQSVEKLRELLISHLNQIGPFRKHELIEPILAVISCLERNLTLDAGQRLGSIARARWC